MKFENLKKLYIHELKDLYSANKQVLDMHSQLMGKTDDDDLKVLVRGLKEVKNTQNQRIETIFKSLEFAPSGHHCVGMEGILKEGKSLLSSDIETEVRDAAIVALLQRVNHYLMAGFGTASAFAEKLSSYEAAERLHESLDEEGRADRALSRLARRKINFEAAFAA